MRSSQCEAIVLGVMEYREADCLVALFTLEHGKLRGIAPGAKKSRRRFAGILEPFARLRLEIAVKEGLSRLHGADPVTVYPGIRRELVKIAHAGYACELSEQFLPEGGSNPRLYRLLVSYLEQLDSAPFAPSDRAFFEVNFLNILGYRPSLDHCVSCGGAILPGDPRRFAPAAGMLLCEGCGKGGRVFLPQAAELLLRALRTGRFGAVTFPPAALREAEELLDGAIAAHLVRPLKSLAFLREIGE